MPASPHILAAIALLAMLPALPVHACSLADNTDESFAAEVDRMPYVFVARIVDFREVGPDADATFGRNELVWKLVEPLKGDLPASGVLAEPNRSLRSPGAIPGPICGPFVATRSRIGDVMLVLAYDPDAEPGGPMYPSHFSMTLATGENDIASDASVSKTRQLIRKGQAKK